MYDSYIVKRTQIYLDPEDASELSRRAAVRGVTASHLIREAIAEYLVGPSDDAAVLAAQRASLLGAAGTVRRLASGGEVVARLRHADRERDRALEARWRSR
jgi:hypothetical protein